MASSDTIDTILARRSVRAYDPKPIPDDDLRAILEATRQAPSASNCQPLHFVVVRDPEQKRRVAEAASQQRWIAEAGVVVVAAAFPGHNGKWYATDVDVLTDAAIALQTLVLAATSLGYGTCWIGAIDEEAIKEIVGLPEGARVAALTPIGSAAERPAARSRKPAEQLFSWDRYGQALPFDL